MSKRSEKKRFKLFFEDTNEKLNAKKINPYKREKVDFKDYLNSYLNEDEDDEPQSI